MLCFKAVNGEMYRVIYSPGQPHTPISVTGVTTAPGVLSMAMFAAAGSELPDVVKVPLKPFSIARVWPLTPWCMKRSIMMRASGQKGESVKGHFYGSY